MFKIKIQSMVDVITNSSTSIYTIANSDTLDTIKDIINITLEIGGSTLTADELFEFKLDYPSYYDDDDFLEKCYEYIIDEVLSEKEVKAFESSDRSLNYCEYHFSQYLTDEIKEKINKTHTENYPYDRGYTITPKKDIENHKQLAILLSNLQNLFGIDASWN